MTVETIVLTAHCSTSERLRYDDKLCSSSAGTAAWLGKIAAGADQSLQVLVFNEESTSDTKRKPQRSAASGSMTALGQPMMPGS